jgi:hypothetical protein
MVLGAQVVKQTAKQDAVHKPVEVPGVSAAPVPAGSHAVKSMAEFRANP